MAALFKRKDKTTIAELEQYYANQNSNSSSRAWGMAFLSLLITVAVIALMFFGVRWLYRTLVDDNNGVSTDTTETADVQLPTLDNLNNEDGTVGDSDGLVASDSSEDTSETTDANNVSTTNNGVVSDEAATTTRDGDDNVANNSDENGSVNGTSTNTETATIPNTGAGEVLLLAPIIAAVIGYRLSLKSLRR